MKDRKEFVPGDKVMLPEIIEIDRVRNEITGDLMLVEHMVRPCLYGKVCSFSPLLKEVYVELKSPYNGGLYHKFHMDQCKNLGPDQDNKADNMARRTPRSMRI